MFLIPAGTALLCQFGILLASTGRQFSGQRGDIAIAQFTGGVVGLCLLSWAVAGAFYLLSRRQMSRAGRSYVASVVIVGLSYFSYLGVTVSQDRPRPWLDDAVMPFGDRKIFMEGMTSRCEKEFRADPPPGVTDAMISDYCECRSGALGSIITPEDIKQIQQSGKPPADLSKHLQEFNKQCAAFAHQEQAKRGRRN
jgi:hypothetical protein